MLIALATNDDVDDALSHIRITFRRTSGRGSNGHAWSLDPFMMDQDPQRVAVARTTGELF